MEHRQCVAPGPEPGGRRFIRSEQSATSARRGVRFATSFECGEVPSSHGNPAATTPTSANYAAIPMTQAVTPCRLVAELRIVDGGCHTRPCHLVSHAQTM